MDKSKRIGIALAGFGLAGVAFVGGCAHFEDDCMRAHDCPPGSGGASSSFGAGGIPLLYIGDEFGQLNEYDYRKEPAKATDSRWVHRPHFPWERAAQREDRSTEAGHIFQGLLQLIDLRKHTPAFGTGRTEFFDTGSDRIQDRSYRLLDTIATVINLHKEIPKVVVAGHTDSRGNPDKNRELSQKRAEAVVKYLIEKGGVFPERLEAKGYGFDEPLLPSAKTAAEHEVNRRVEFRIER